jgi:flagellar motor switch protein FliN/FliY
MSLTSSTPAIGKGALFGQNGDEAAPSTGAVSRAGSVEAQAVDFAELTGNGGDPVLNSLDQLLDVTVTVTAELGRVTRSIADVLKFGIGTVVELDRPVSEPVDILVQGVRIARGEVVVVGDRFAVRITEIVDTKKRQVR